jgi:murein DD-endopeptidase MepM/ murein hydrolase activator NlpD
LPWGETAFFVCERLMNGDAVRMMLSMRRFVILSSLSVLLLGGCLTQSPAPVTTYGVSAGLGSGGVHIVRSGETIWSIAHRYHVVMDDLAYANSLGGAYGISPGQRLSLPPPPEYRVRRGDSLSSVARIFGVSTRRMADENGISAPYIVHAGDVLKLPRVSADEVSQGYEPVQMASLTQQGRAAEAQDFVVPSRKPVVTQKGAPKVKNSRVTTKPPKRASSKFLRPVDGKIVSNYGAKKGGLHNDGVNILAPRGTPIKAADNGVVVYAGSEIKGSGNLVLVRHSDRWMTAYAHMDKITVKRGATIARGSKIGTVGSTGSVDKPQLHFEVRRGTTAINPKKYL